jgi:hypothetical protein
MFIHFVGDRNTDTKTPQVSSDFAAAIGFVAYNSTRTVLRPASSTAFDRPTGH